MIGETIGNFKLVAQIGRGGMGEVYLAEQASIGTTVAVKILLAEISADTNQVQRFFNEARAVSKIKHAGTVKIFDVGFHRGQAYLIMEHLDGEGLGDRMERLKRIPLAQLVDVGRQIASVLDATHAVGIIHRDLKPDNIFLVHDQELDGRERVKILDFGIAKLTDGASSARTIGTIGTPTYMAPEQWGDSSSVDWRADMYSLGCVIYEMACGFPPFRGVTIPELYAQHLRSEVVSIRTIAPELPPALDQLLAHMLAKAPSDRPDSMRTVMRRFDALTVTTPNATTMNGSPAASRPMPKAAADEPRPNTTLNQATSELFHQPRSRGPVIPLVLGVAIVVVVIAIAVAIKQRKTTEVAATPSPPVADVVPAATPIDAALAIDAGPPTFEGWLATANPWVTHAGLATLSHQVTRDELRHYLDSLPAAVSARNVPLSHWDASNPGSPVAWLSQDRAGRFCAAIGGRLPSYDEWSKLADGSWGIDATGTGKRGPLQEWTSTAVNGFAFVAGGHEGMTPERQKQALAEPFQKQTEALGGNANTLAGERIGFRCIR